VKVQRLRLAFAREEEAKDLSHLEVMRGLEQGMREAGLPLAYSEGKRPTAQISIAAPLPVGVTSACELADLYLSERVKVSEALAALAAALPPGLLALAAREVGLVAPALQAEVRWSEYEVDVPLDGRSSEEVRIAIARLLSARTLPWEHQRETKVRRYDLRPLVLSLGLEAEGEGVCRLAMRLVAGQERSGRAEQVVAALGLPPPLRIHRRALYIRAVPAVLRAYRRAGQPDD
jgi:radical SAM-linked protein